MGHRDDERRAIASRLQNQLRLSRLGKRGDRPAGKRISREVCAVGSCAANRNKYSARAHEARVTLHP
jgi:hypothetical protein